MTAAALLTPCVTPARSALDFSLGTWFAVNASCLCRVTCLQSEMKHRQGCTRVEGCKHRNAGLGCVNKGLAGDTRKGSTVRTDERGVVAGPGPSMLDHQQKLKERQG